MLLCPIYIHIVVSAILKALIIVILMPKLIELISLEFIGRDSAGRTAREDGVALVIRRHR